MLPPKSETPTWGEYFPDLYAEPRDCANQWDVRALWPDREPQPADTEQPFRRNDAHLLAPSELNTVTDRGGRGYDN